MVYTFGPQMRAFVFFVYLCFLLLKGGDCVFSIKTQSTKFVNTDQEQAVVKHTGSNEEKKSLICVDVEDEDDVLAGKYRFLTKGNLTQTLTYIPGDPWGYSNDKLPFCCHLSYKYLIQRALRI